VIVSRENLTKNKFLNKTQTKEKEKQQQKLQCPSCKADIAEGDKFCADCGASIEGNHCPNCNALTYPGADICEACGEWLLPGKCRFCYSSIKPDDAFCPECGNPAMGIICPKCGTKNFFDFCKKCNTPLSESAQNAIRAAQQNRVLQDFLRLQFEAEKIKAEIEKNSPLPEPIKTPEQLKAEQEKAEKRAILLQIQALKEQNSTKKEVPTPAAKPKPLFSEEDKKRLDAAINRKKELEQKQQELINKLSSAQNQTFETPQQARCFYNANKPASNLMWECNYVHYVHPGPHDCARPDLGGKWIIDYGK